MKITVLYVGSSLLAPLRKAEREINQGYGLDLLVTTHNFGQVFCDDEWREIENDVTGAEVVFVIHVMDGENAARLVSLLDRSRKGEQAVIIINCMPELMKCTRMGKLDFARLPGTGARNRKNGPNGKGKSGAEVDAHDTTSLMRTIGSWVATQARQKRSNSGARNHHRAEYLKFADRLPSLLRFVPNSGALRDVRNYLMLFCYFLQPSPQNIRAMLLYALKNYAADPRLKQLQIEPPESLPVIGIYHPDAPALFGTFAAYDEWYSPRRDSEGSEAVSSLRSDETVGLLLLRPQIVSDARKHYDGLIRAIEAEGLRVLPIISTLMDNREACEKFLVGPGEVAKVKAKPSPASKESNGGTPRTPRVSQIVSLTGFSFVGGPAMNDSEAAEDFLSELNIPYRSLISLDTQTIESWQESFTGLNPVQTGMQVAIPEIDGATEPIVFGGIPEQGVEPVALEDRCRRVAQRLKRWRRLQTSVRADLRVALVVYCFPPNKGNIGTAADLDVMLSVFEIIRRLKQEMYQVEVPQTPDDLRAELLAGNSWKFDTTGNVAYEMNVDEYRRLCPFVDEIEADWGKAPGAINSFGDHLLIQGIRLGNIFIGIQPTFGYEDDPMRLLMSKSGTPHHGFAAFYTYLQSIFCADAVIHVGTHGATEFMPGKQVGLSSRCWPDRLIGDLPNLYLYSVNNPSEGTIAKRRSYAELISYLTPPIENAGLYKGLATLKDSILAYRASDDEQERQRLFQTIEECSRTLNLSLD